MQAHAIIELEEGALNVAVGVRERGATRVLRSVRLPLADLGKETLQNALRGVGADMLQGAAGVHVVLGDRRAQHFLSTLPRTSPRDAVAYVTREAVRLANAQSADEVLVATRVVRRLGGGKVLLGTSALPRNAWASIEAAFKHSEMPVLGLQTMESCLALAIPVAISEPVAVLECNAGRARFVLCVDQTPIQVRRFLIGTGGETNSAALSTQLMMELPRTFDWLRETGQPLPQWLLLGHRVPVDEESLDMLRGEDLAQISRASSPLQLDDGQAPPSLGAAILLDRLCRGEQVISLLEPSRLLLPWGKGRLASFAAAAAVGLICTYSAIVDGRVWLRTTQEREDLAAQAHDLEARLAGVDPLASPTVEPGDDPRLLEVLKRRRPISRLIAELSNSCEATVRLQEVTFASTERVVVTGIVDGDSRQVALGTMARLAQRLRELPYLLADGHEEVGEVDGQPNCFRFKLSLSWRNS